MPGERIVYLFMASLEAVNDFAFSFFLKKNPSFFFVGGCEIDRYPAHRWNARDMRTQLQVQLVEEGKISKQLEDHRDKVHPNVCTIL